MNDNQIKSINGKITRKPLELQLQALQSSGVIAFCSMQYRKGYAGYDSQQFFAPFYIEFLNGEGWLIFSSTSIRNDRMNNQQWNSLHLKRISTNITKSYLVIPDEIVINEREKKIASSYQKKITTSMYSSIDDVCYQSEIIDLIEQHSNSLSSGFIKVSSHANQEINGNIAAEPSFNTLLIGCYKDEEHLLWILTNRLYNIRLNRKGAIKRTYLVNGATKLLLYRQNNHKTYKYFNLSGKIEQANGNRMKELNYPGYQQGREYLLYQLTTELTLPAVSIDALIERFKPSNWVLYSPIFVSFNGDIEDLSKI